MLNIQIFNHTKAIHFLCSTIPAVKKKKLKGSTKASLWPALWLAIQKEVISKPKQPSCIATNSPELL